MESTYSTRFYVNGLYQGKAPIFVTTRRDAVTDVVRSAAAAPRGEHSMLLRRLRLYHFTVEVPKPVRRIHPCPRCFATLVKSKADEWRGQPSVGSS